MTNWRNELRNEEAEIQLGQPESNMPGDDGLHRRAGLQFNSKRSGVYSVPQSEREPVISSCYKNGEHHPGCMKRQTSSQVV